MTTKTFTHHNIKVSGTQLEALRDAADGCLFRKREDGTFVRRPTVDALIGLSLLSARFPHSITDAGLAIIEAADDLER